MELVLEILCRISFFWSSLNSAWCCWYLEVYCGDLEILATFYSQIFVRRLLCALFNILIYFKCGVGGGQYRLMLELSIF